MCPKCQNTSSKSVYSLDLWQCWPSPLPKGESLRWMVWNGFISFVLERGLMLLLVHKEAKKKKQNPLLHSVDGIVDQFQWLNNYFAKCWEFWPQRSNFILFLNRKRSANWSLEMADDQQLTSVGSWVMSLCWCGRGSTEEAGCPTFMVQILRSL